MTDSSDFEPGESARHGRGKRIAATIVAALVIFAVLCFIELTALAFLAAASSAFNHHGLAS